MTDQPAPPSSATAASQRARVAASQRARVAASAKVPAKKRRRHPARGARIAAAGIGATAMVGLVGAMASAPPAAPSPDPAPPTQVVVVVHHPDGRATSEPSSNTAQATRLEVRPTVRPAPSTSRSPAAKTHGSR